jgi:hypothetical protein
MEKKVDFGWSTLAGLVYARVGHSSPGFSASFGATHSAIATSATLPLLPFAFFPVSLYN